MPVDMGDDRQIKVARGHPLHQVRRGFAHHRNLGLRVRARESGQDLRQVAVGIVIRHAQPDPALEVGIAEAGDAFEVQPDDAARIIEDALTILGQSGVAAVALEQRPADPLLKPLDLHRHRRLRLVHHIRRLGERARIDNRDEGAKLVGIQNVGHGAFSSE